MTSRILFLAGFLVAALPAWAGPAAVVREVEIPVDPGVSWERAEEGLRLVLPGGLPAATPGAQDLPVIAVTVRPPEGMRLAGVEATALDLVPLSVPGPLARVPGPDGAAATALPPLPLAQAGGGGYERGERLDHVILSPVQAAPGGGWLLATRVTLRLRFEGDAPENVVVPRRGPRGAPAALPGHVVDFRSNALRASRLRPSGYESEGDRYPAPFDPTFRPSLDGSPVPVVMVTGAALTAEIQRLADWRTRGGTPAVVRTVEWITAAYPEGVDLAEKIRLFLRDAVTYWGTEWVLLAGDADIIPVRYARSTFVIPDLIPCDLYYQGLDGNWNGNGNLTFGEVGTDQVDLLPELAAGRLPVSTVRDAQVMVDKILHYETAPPVGGGYPASALFMAEVIFPQVWSAGQSIGIDGTEYAEEIAVRLPPSFEMRKLFENYLPFPGAEPETLSTVRNALNAGYGIVYHVGHGFVDNMSVGLGDLSLVVSDADALANGDRTFLLYSVNCSSGAVDFDAIGEHFLKNPNGGAVGAVASTRLDYAGVSRWIARRFYERVFEPIDTLVTPDAAARVGWALAQAKSEFILSSGDEAGGFRWTQFTLGYLGDPQLRLWTGSPGVLFVQHPASVPAGDGPATVTVSEGGIVVPDARVTWWKDGETLATGLTDANGTATLAIRPLSAGIIRLTVTAPQRIPYLADVTVTAGPARLVLARTDIDDTAPGLGNGNGRVEAGETARVTFTLRNPGPGALTGLVVGAASSVPQVTVTPLPGAPATLAEGAEGSWDVDVAADAAMTASADLVIDLSLSADQGTWWDRVVLYVGSPSLALYEMQVTEVVGDGDGKVGPFEVVDLGPLLFNGGSGESLPLGAKMTFEIQNGAGFLVDSTQFAPVAAGGTGTPVAAIRLVTDAIPPRIRLTVTDRGGPRLSAPLDLVPPPVPSDPEASGAESRIVVSWSKSPSPDVARYVLYRSDDSQGPFERVNGYEALPMQFHADEGLPGFTEFWYRVAAQDSSGNLSAPSAVVRGTTSLPLLPNFPLPSRLGTSASPTVADLDGDGRTDVVAAREEIYAFHADGTEVRDGDADARTLGPWSAVRPGAGFFASPAVGDVDGDGRLEVVAVSFREGRVYVWERNGRLLPGWPRSTWTGPVSALSSPCLADLTGDGLPEIIVQVEGAVYAFDRFGNEVRDGDGNPATRGVFFSTGGKFCYGSVAAADIDADGKAELVVPVRIYSGPVTSGKVYLLDDNGASLPGWPIAFSGEVTSSPALADLDGDGTVEILFATGSDSLEVRRVNGTSVPGWPRDVLMNRDIMSSPAVADLDGDGDLEIVVVGGSGKVLAWNANGTLVSGFPYQYTDAQGRSFATTGSPTLANIDADPDFEIVYGNQSGWILAVERNGVLATGFPLKLGGGMEGGVLVDDLDGDGRNELAVTSLDQNIFVYRTTGTAVSRPAWPMFRHDPRRTGLAGPVTREALTPRLMLGVLPTIFRPDAVSVYLVASRQLRPDVAMSLDGQPLTLETVDPSRVFYRAIATVGAGGHVLDASGTSLDGLPAQATRSFGVLLAPAEAGWTESTLGVRAWADGAPGWPSRLLVAAVDGTLGRLAGDLVPPGEGTMLYVGPEGDSLPGGSQLAFTLPDGWVSARVLRWDAGSWTPASGLAQSGREVRASGERLGWFRLVEAGEPLPPPRPSLAVLGFHPNPMGARASLEFSLSASDRVTVDVFDLRGARVRQLVDERFPEGTHAVEWDGRDDRALLTAPGVYFARVVGGGATRSRKIVRVGGGAP